MTRDQFIYALTACGCLLKDGKTWYEHNELIKCFEDLGLFKLEPIIDEIRADVKAKIEEEEFARSVFRREEKDTAKTEQCTGSIMAYNNVIKLIDEYKAEVEPQERED